MEGLIKTNANAVIAQPECLKLGRALRSIHKGYIRTGSR